MDTYNQVLTKLNQSYHNRNYRGMQRSLKVLRDVFRVEVIGRLNCKKGVMVAIASQVLTRLITSNSLPASAFTKHPNQLTDWRLRSAIASQDFSTALYALTLAS